MPKLLFSLPLYESAIHQESKRHESNLKSTNVEHGGFPFAYQLKHNFGDKHHRVGQLSGRDKPRGKQC